MPMFPAPANLVEESGAHLFGVPHGHEHPAPTNAAAPQERQTVPGTRRSDERHKCLLFTRTSETTRFRPCHDGPSETGVSKYLRMSPKTVLQSSDGGSRQLTSQRKLDILRQPRAPVNKVQIIQQNKAPVIISTPEPAARRTEKRNLEKRTPPFLFFCGLDCHSGASLLL